MRIIFSPQDGLAVEEVAEYIRQYISAIFNVYDSNFGKLTYTEDYFVDFEWFGNSADFPGQQMAEMCMLKFATPSDFYLSPPSPGPTEGEVIAEVSGILDGRAQEYGYDNIVSAISYWHSDLPKFRKEGRAFSKWRDLVWQRCYEILEEVNSDVSQVNMEEAIASLPAFEDVLATVVV